MNSSLHTKQAILSRSLLFKKKSISETGYSYDQLSRNPLPMYWKFVSVLVLIYLNELATNSIVTQGTCGIAVAFYRLGSFMKLEY